MRHWPIDRLRRRRPALRHKPFVLIETSGNRQTVVHVSPEAAHHVRPGMSLAEARARCATLTDLPATPAADLRSLEALGYWLTRFSPSVSVYGSASLFLDATGLERLFGSLHEVRTKVAEALKRLRMEAGVAVAPTPGAAWALAAFGSGAGAREVVVGPGDSIADVLSPLPPEALRLEPATAGMLGALGVRTIGALLKLPRGQLAVRFGAGILERIDQATGAFFEPLTFLPHRAPVRATLEFDGATESSEVMALAVQALTHEVAGQLAARGLGARELRMSFGQPYAPPVEKVVRLVRPCRNESALLKLIHCAIETLEGADGFVSAGIEVPVTEALGDEQAALIGGEDARDAAELDHLVERLRARLDKGVEWGELVESNVPECAWRCRESATPGAVEVRARGAVDLLRPLRLLREPRPIPVIVRPSASREGDPVSFTDEGGEVHRLAHVRGPERITGRWWNGRWKTRDYFDVLDAAGNRYWVFRVAQTGRWFLHGVFE